MFGSTMLEVALGMALIYTVLSLVCSAVREAIESWTKSRSADLERGIRQLLSGNARTGGAWRWIKETVLGHWLDLQGTADAAQTAADASGAVVAKFYKHPLIQSLYSGSTGPSYIPTRHFVATVLDLVHPAVPGAASSSGAGGTGGATAPSGGGTTPPPLTLNDIVVGIRNSPALPAGLRTAVEALALQAGGDLESFKAALGDWFDGTMDRVAGWYKRRTQAILFVIGFCVAVATNADTLLMANKLARDQATRASLVSAAEAYSALPEEQRTTESEIRTAVTSGVTQVQQSGIPIGWRDCPAAADAPAEPKADCFPGSPASLFHRDAPPLKQWAGQWWEQLQIHFFGWLLTALALTLGAPFWFDMLNKVMVIRSTVKPREKSPEEGSEDRPRGQVPTLNLKVQGGSVGP